MCLATTSLALQAALIVLLVVAYSPGSTRAFYVDTNAPYSFGALNVSFAVATAEENGAILHTNIFFPTQPDDYAVVYFVGGGPDGVIPSIMYEDFLRHVASHGFIVVGVDYYWPSWLPVRRRREIRVTVSEKIIVDHFMQFDWLKKNLRNFTGKAEPRWDHTAIGCHSAGCQVTLDMVLRNNTFVNATLFMEPASGDLKAPVQFRLPAYMYGTEYAGQFDPFPCSIPGLDYNHFYENWKCPRYVTEIKAYGHCDILNKIPWESCKAIHFCKVVGNWTRIYPAYQTYVQGAASAFFIGHVQGNAAALKYITNESLMPLAMLKVESDADGC